MLKKRVSGVSVFSLIEIVSAMFVLGVLAACVLCGLLVNYLII